MKRSIFFSLIFLASAFAFAQTPDAEYKVLKQSYTLNSDGTLDYHYRKEMVIHRNRAMTAYADKGETFILYNPDFQTLNINESYTLRADGTKVETPRNAFIDQLPSQAVNCGRFNRLRELAIVHTALEYECTIVLDYTIHSTNVTLLTDKIQITQDCPINHYELEIDLPYGQTLYYSVLNQDKGSLNVSSTQNNLFITADQVPQTYGEAYLPDPLEIYPTVAFSNVLDFTRYIMNLVSPGGDYTSVESTPEALRDYVVDNINTNPLPMSLLNYDLVDVSTIWYSNCATPEEKAYLLADMLQRYNYSDVNVIIGSQPFTTEDGTTFMVPLPSRSRVQFTINGIAHTLFANDKRPLRITDSAIDEVSTASDSKTINWKPQTTKSKYHTITLPETSEKGCKMNPALLTSSRKAPVKATPVNERYTYQYNLPKGYKMLTNPVNITIKEPGLGTLVIDIKQEGQTIKVVKHLMILPSIINADQYPTFRKMLSEWNSHNQITVKGK